MKIERVLVSLLLLFLLGACVSEPESLVVMTHDSFAISESVITAFEEANGVDVIFLPSGDAGSALNRAILSKGAPVADILYGIDNTFLSRALDEGLFAPYTPASISSLLPDIDRVADDQVVPVDFGDVCINYDRAYFTDSDLPLPNTLQDLLDPAYAGLLVVENPATSSPGLAFLLATIAEFGQDGYLDFWRALMANGAVVVNDWETAYYTNFSGSAGRGPQPMVVSYATSPAAEVIFAETELGESPTASLVGPNMCFRQIEYAGILKEAENRDMAEKFIDYMLDIDFQSDIPLNMFVYPVNQQVDLPAEFIQYAQVPASPARLDGDAIAENREFWVEALRALITE